MLIHQTMKILFAMLVVLYPTTALLACGCNKPRTVEDVNRFAHHIFKGRVTNVVTTKDAGGRYQIVTFDVLEMRKGQATKKITIEFGHLHITTSCDLERPAFVVGAVYWLSDFEQSASTGDKKRQHKTGYISNFCSLREEVKPETQQ
jgi:hypothetical protein